MSGLTCCTASALSFSWRAFRRCASCSRLRASALWPCAASARSAALSASSACAAQCTCAHQEPIPTEQTPVLQLIALQQSSCASALRLCTKPGALYSVAGAFQGCEAWHGDWMIQGHAYGQSMQEMPMVRHGPLQDGRVSLRHNVAAQAQSHSSATACARSFWCERTRRYHAQVLQALTLRRCMAAQTRASSSASSVSISSTAASNCPIVR